jgi:hypothetical protein
MKHHTSKGEKLYRLAKALQFYMNDETESSREIINRQRLRETIAGELGLIDRQQISTWINALLGSHLLAHNCTSQLSNQKHLIMPNDNTKYRLNGIAINDTVQTLAKKYDPSLSPQTQLCGTPETTKKQSSGNSVSP